MSETYLVVDVSNLCYLCYRAFHSMKNLSHKEMATGRTSATDKMGGEWLVVTPPGPENEIE